MTDSPELSRAVSAAEQAALVLREFRHDAGVESLKGKDIKTRADREAEAAIITVLGESGFPILAEESSAGQGALGEGPCWIVDPLDGTMNFVRGFGVYGVSIALWQDKAPRLGVVWDAMSGLIFRGEVGKGAWHGEKRISVSTILETAQAVLATGFPVGRNYDDTSLATFMRRVQQFKKIRMLGSAALSLAWVAAGSFDAYFEEDIMIWDVAAGLALVKAAGGHVDVVPGSHPHSVHVFASNGRIQNPGLERKSE